MAQAAGRLADSSPAARMVAALLDEDDDLAAPNHAVTNTPCASTPLRRPARKSFSWADATPSDDSCLEDHDIEEPPLRDDSYREKPLASLEDSRDGLNVQLRLGADLGSGAPLDFNFLVGRSPAGPSQHLWQAEESHELNISTPPRTTWQPNLNAPEFIPTTSMECVLLGQQAAAAASSSRTPFGESGACAPVKPASSDATTPEKTFPGTIPGSCAGEGRRQRSGAAKKRRPPALQAPSEKRTKSEERETPAGAERRQRAAAHARAKAAPPARATPPPVAVPLPEASEEEWQHRIAMRRKAVAVGKDTPEYRWYTEARLRDEGSCDGLKTPDPTDRRVSKRYWKYTLQQWRVTLKQRHHEARCSATSTEAPDGDNASSTVSEK